MVKNQNPTQLARNLRQNPTAAERLLWEKLKNKQLEDVKFRRQQSIGPYIVDFISFESKLVIEVDGGQHNEEAIRKKDEQRTSWLEGQGFQILRFWNNDVIKNLDGVLERIRASLQ